MLLNLHAFNELISVLCAISFGLCHKCHMTMICIDSSSIHELSFKKAEYCESSCTECVYVHSYVKLGYNDHFIYFVLIFFYCSILFHDHSLFFVAKF